jgi:hypothetical protein
MVSPTVRAEQVRLPRDAEPAEIADVLADREGAVDSVIRNLGGS